MVNIGKKSEGLALREGRRLQPSLSVALPIGEGGEKRGRLVLAQEGRFLSRCNPTVRRELFSERSGRKGDPDAS